MEFNEGSRSALNKDMYSKQIISSLASVEDIKIMLSHYFLKFTN